MGVVYKARDKRLNRFVALKLLPADKLGDEERIRRFTQEARTASALNHPNIITIHDVGTEGGFHFIVMEYLSGKTLDQLIPRKGMRLAEVLKISVQIADALAAAGRAGVIHRDVKPGNVMVSESGHVKVLDFGLSKLAAIAASPEQPTVTIALPDEDRPRTVEGTVMGTVSYMSPEQAQGKPLDLRTDIFSFGALLYEMTTGQRAFRGDNNMSTISSILRDDPKPAGQLSEDVPRDLDQIINRCLRKDPDRRFQHMADVRVALLELKDESDSGKLVAASGPARRALWPWISTGCAILLIAAVAIGFRSRLRPAAIEPGPRTNPFTVYTGLQGEPAFSPDGNQIAFPWNGDEGSILHIYVKMIGTETPLRITSGSFSDRAPAWSPDGRSIAFVRMLPQNLTGIYQVSPLGGPERRISEIVRSPDTRVNWSQDGKWLVTCGRETQGKPSRILVISADTGQIRALTFGGTPDEYSPALSPDSHLLAFNRVVADLVTDLFVVGLDERLQPRGEPWRVHTAVGGGGSRLSSAWTADSSEIVFAAEGQLWRVPAKEPARPRAFPISSRNARYPAIALHGNRMAFLSGFTDANVWSIAITGPARAGEPVQRIASTRSDVVRSNGFSPDGQRVAFESDRSGTTGVWVADADGSRPACLFGCTGSGVSGSPAWSPDGKWIAFDTRKDGNAEVCVISAEGGAPRRITTHAADDVIPLWSRDGKWIYFASNRTGRFEIFKMSASGGDHAIQITRQGGWAPQESADGKFLYFTRSRSPSPMLFQALQQPLIRIPVDGGEEEQVMEAVCDRSWVLGTQGIWFLWPAGPARSELRLFNPGDRKVTTVASVAKPFFTSLAISPDGHTLLYNQVDHQQTEINLVENFK